MKVIKKITNKIFNMIIKKVNFLGDVKISTTNIKVGYLNPKDIRTTKMLK